MSETVPDPQAFRPRPVREISRVPVLEAPGGAEIGEVVQFEVEEATGPVRLWRVRNRSGQWLGSIDAQGRFFRVEPFSDDERFLGVYSMEEGLPLLFETERVAVGDGAVDPGALPGGVRGAGVREASGGR